MIIGIDVSKDKLDIQVLPEEKHHVIKNTKQGIQNFFTNSLKGALIDLVVFESTGGYERVLQLFLMNKEMAYHIVHPTRARYFCKAKGYLAKTDRIDAMALAEYGSQEEIQADSPTSVKQLKLRDYSARRVQLKVALQAERNRLKTVETDSFLTRSVKRQIKSIERELELVTKAFDELVCKDEKLSRLCKILQSYKGIGKEVSRVLIGMLPELGQVSKAEISCLVGVAPVTCDSGKMSRHRSIGHGRFHVRKALYMSALVAANHNPKMKAFYKKLVSAGKKTKVALVAIIRRIVVTLNSMVRNDTMWECEEI